MIDNARPVHEGTLTRMWTKCPLPYCESPCAWYRLSDVLVGVCPEHGEIDTLPLAPPKN